MIERLIVPKVQSQIGSGKAIVVMGARQVGKTTLLHSVMGNKENVLWLNGDDVDTRIVLDNPSSTRLKAIIGKKDVVVIDEAQRIQDVGAKLKLITDQIPEVQLIATGSSSFDLASQINEPLTGRKREHTLYPLSFEEMVNHHGLLDELRLMPHRMVYGSYPEVITEMGDEQAVLKELSESYLYKDIFAWGKVKKSDNIVRLLQALAYQVGSEVSYTELGQTCGLDYKTVERYVDLLEQAYIVFRLSSLSRNLRNELKKSRKIYFYDNGIRNAVIANFAQVEARQDVGALWENYLISERMKALGYHEKWTNRWFWRTVQQKEIDYVEERNGQIHAYEFKWNPKAKVKEPKQFLDAYPGSTFKVISQHNVEEFLLIDD